MHQIQLDRPIGMEPGRLTIGVAAHGNVSDTTTCLKSIFASVHGGFDLVLVDDDSPDNMLSLFSQARATHAGTRIYRFNENMNLGLGQSRIDLDGDLVFLAGGLVLGRHVQNPVGGMPSSK